MKLIWGILGMILGAGISPGKILEEVDTYGVAGFQHAGSLSEIVCLDDGKHVLSSSRDECVRLWEIETGKLVRLFTTEGSGDMWGLRVLPGGKEFLVAGGSGKVIRFEIATGKVIKTYQHEDTVYRIALHPDGKRFVATDDKNLALLWLLDGEAKVEENVEEEADEEEEKPEEIPEEGGEEEAPPIDLGPGPGGKVRTFKGHTSDIYTAIIVNDGKTLVTGSSDDTFRTWDLETGKHLKTFQGEKQSKFGDVFTLAASPDKSRFAMVSGDNRVRVYDSKTIKEIWEIKLPQEAQVIDWSPDGQLLAAASDDKNLYILDAADGKVRNKIRVARYAHTPIAFAKDGTKIISGGDNLLHVHEVTSGKRVEPTMGLPVNSDGIEYAFLRNDGKVAMTAGGQEFHVWNLEGDEEPQRFSEVRDITAMAVSCDGSLVALGGSGGEITIRQTSDFKKVGSLMSGRRVSGLAFMPDGTGLVSAGDDELVTQWHIESGNKIKVLKGAEDDINDLVISEDGQIVVTSDDNQTVKIWSLDSGMEEMSFNLGNHSPSTLALLGGGRSLLVGVGGTELFGRLLPRLAENVDVDPERIKELVESLASLKFEVRQGAVKELAAMGSDVIPILEELDIEDPEVQARMRGVKTVIRGAGGKKKLDSIHKFKSSLRNLEGDPLGKYWAGAIGWDGTSKLVIGTAEDEKFEVLEEAGNSHGVGNVTFSSNGRFLTTVNNDGTFSVFEINRD